MKADRSFRAWLEICRTSNLPTCISGVLTGTALARGSAPVVVDQLILLTVAVALMYCGGMMLNDFIDVEFDRVSRPSRALPSGRLSRRRVFYAVIGAFTLALILLGGLRASAVLGGAGLIATIIAYDVVHKKTALASVLMGMCRGGVYGVTVLAWGWPPAHSGLIPLGLALVTYTVVLTAAARREHESGSGQPRLAGALLLVISLSALIWIQPQQWYGTIPAAALLAGWVLGAGLPQHSRTSAWVHRWLAGFCLVDAYFLTLLQRDDLALVAGICFLVTVWGHRRVAGT